MARPRWVRLPRWLDGIRGRMAAALLAALVVQFVGSEIIFARVEREYNEQASAQRLADWLSFADEFASSRPDALGRMTALWEPNLAVRRGSARSDASPSDYRVRDEEIESLVTAARPQLAGRDFRAWREGRAVAGSMRIGSGERLEFRAEDYLIRRSLWWHYMASLLLLVVSVVVIALVFGRAVSRPLARISRASEHVGRDVAVPIHVEGPREVRQVAAAFERMQTRLLSHVREREESLAAMSHDLRTPLARLKLNVSGVDDAETRAALQTDIAEMEAFVGSVLDYLRGDEAEPEQRTDIASVVMTVVDEANDRGEPVAYRGPDRLELVTRPLKLKRLVRNLVQNATRYAGEAKVELATEGEQVVITVADRGPGIPAEHLNAVFEPFRRLDSSRGKHAGGVGLGLAITQRLALRLGGTIELENRTGGGLRATVRLSLAEHPSRPPPRPQGPSAALRSAAPARAESRSH